jgi:hypothetical protein
MNKRVKGRGKETKIYKKIKQKRLAIYFAQNKTYMVLPRRPLLVEGSNSINLQERRAFREKEAVIICG